MTEEQLFDLASWIGSLGSQRERAIGPLSNILYVRVRVRSAFPDAAGVVYYREIEDGQITAWPSAESDAVAGSVRTAVEHAGPDTLHDLSFSPDAIREHFEVEEGVEDLTDADLREVANVAMCSDHLYRAYDEVLRDALNQLHPGVLRR